MLIPSAKKRNDHSFSSPGGTERLNHDPLDLVERDLVSGAVVELGRARAFVREI
jgi:hypothetical protein